MHGLPRRVRSNLEPFNGAFVDARRTRCAAASGKLGGVPLAVNRQRGEIVSGGGAVKVGSPAAVGVGRHRSQVVAALAVPPRIDGRPVQLHLAGCGTLRVQRAFRV